jgi:hypothetical protein
MLLLAIITLSAIVFAPLVLYCISIYRSSRMLPRPCSCMTRKLTLAVVNLLRLALPRSTCTATLEDGKLTFLMIFHPADLIS